MVGTLTRHKPLILLGILLLYILARIGLSLPALSKPRQVADTTAYLRISGQPLTSDDFWGSSRPFVFPLLLKAAGQNLRLAAVFQLGISIISWGLLAWVISAFMRRTWLAPLSFLLILFLSLVPHLAAWDFTMLTESLSVSTFVLFLASGLWLLQRWSWPRLALVCVAAFFLAFTRDTNAYLLLAVAALVLLAVLLGWTAPRNLVIVGVFAGIFLLSNATADLGGRWVFPLINVIGRRVLTDTGEVHFLQSTCDMPVSPALMGMKNEFANGQERAFYENAELDDFRAWLREDGKRCYASLLLSDPVHSLGEPLVEFNGLINFRQLRNFFSPRYDPLVPFTIEPFLYPVRNALVIWIVLTLTALVVLFVQPWKQNPLWAGFIFLTLTIFPHLFITWHGDAMAPERHAISVGLQIALAAWILVMLLMDRSSSQPAPA